MEGRRGGVHAAFQMPTHELGAASRPDGPLYGIENTVPGRIVLFGGGFPYLVDGKVAGGIGVAGGAGGTYLARSCMEQFR